jgi:hypothetical protein
MTANQRRLAHFTFARFFLDAAAVRDHVSGARRSGHGRRLITGNHNIMPSDSPGNLPGTLPMTVPAV